MSARPKLAMYWAASCGGCEVAVANTGTGLLEIDAAFDFMFCPCLMDTKKADVEALADGEILLTLFNGALRTEENVEMAHLLRRKSAVMVAFGACAAWGGIPALANGRSLGSMLDTVFCTRPSNDNPANLVPGTSHEAPEGLLTLPGFLPRVKALHEEVAVEYTMPGCPPEPEQIIAVVRHVASGAPLPAAGSIIGAVDEAVCVACPRERRGVLAGRLLRPYEAIPEPGWCLLEQGFVCVGAATRAGCGALCPAVAMPCTGCYGPLDLDGDPGAASLSGIAAAVEPGPSTGRSEATAHEQMRAALAGIADPMGTFYRYSLASTVVADRDQETIA